MVNQSLKNRRGNIVKVLWLCNIILPEISKALNEEIIPYGGWLSSLVPNLRQKIEIIVCFPYARGSSPVWGETVGLNYYGFVESADSTETFISIIQKYSPDLIQIWGTEYKHCLDMVNAAERLNMSDRVVIHIQGLVSIYGRYHYYCGLPEKICKYGSVSEWKNRNTIEYQKKGFEKSGIYEIEALRKVRHVMGRTDWDEACTKQINPHITYHFCNESLRDSFYRNHWNISECRKHSIFVSQSSYPIKGFHLMLDAMPMILEKYPDTKLFTTGYKPKKPENWGQMLRQQSYPKYILEQLDRYHLHENVSFLGFLDETEMCEQYLKSNVFVSPSSIENSSNSVGEAMLLGLPVVASDVGGIKNLMEHNREGYIYQQDAPYMLAYYVCKVFEDDEKAVELGRNAHVKASIIYNREINSEALMNIYISILAE